MDSLQNNSNRDVGILSQTVRFNDNIHVVKETVVFQSWSTQGIRYIYDVVDEKGHSPSFVQSWRSITLKLIKLTNKPHSVYRNTVDNRISRS